MSKILAFVGMPGSGKGTCTDYLESKGYPKVYFGGMVYDEVRARGLDTVKDEKMVRTDMREKEGLAVLAKRAAIKADEYFANGKETVVFDGLYSWTEYKYLREKYGDDLIVIALVAPRQERYDRVVARKDGVRTYTREVIIQREYDEVENLEKGGPIAMADYTLANTKTQQELLAELDALLVKLEV